MGHTRWAVAAAGIVLLLAGCGGGTTPEGLAEALADDGIGLDPATSAERYYATVEGLCDIEGTYPENITRGLARPENADALRRMVVGMNYVCGDDQGDELRQVIELVYQD